MKNEIYTSITQFKQSLKKINENIDNNKPTNFSKAKIYIQSVGDYSTFDLLQLIPVYDVTNDIQLDHDLDLQQIQDMIKNGDHQYDYKLVDSIFVDNKYYFTLD